MRGAAATAVSLADSRMYGPSDRAEACRSACVTRGSRQARGGGASACTSSCNVATAARPGGCRPCPPEPGDGKAAGEDLQDLWAAANSRPMAHRTESTRNAAPEPGSPEAAGIAAGLPAPPRSHLQNWQ